MFTLPQNYPVGSEQYVRPGLPGHRKGPREVSRSELCLDTGPQPPFARTRIKLPKVYPTCLTYRIGK